MLGRADSIHGPELPQLPQLLKNPQFPLRISSSPATSLDIARPAQQPTGLTLYRLNHLPVEAFKVTCSPEIAADFANPNETTEVVYAATGFAMFAGNRFLAEVAEWGIE